MPSKQDNRGDPHGVLEIAPDVVLVARAAAEFPTLAPDSASQPFDRQPNPGAGAASSTGSPSMGAPWVDTSFRATDVNEIPRGRSSAGRWAKTAALAFAFAFVSALGTAAWERYGDQAQAMVAGFVPQIDLASLASWLPRPLGASAAQPDATSLSSGATDQPATLAQSADNGSSGTATAPQVMSADTAQTLQAVSRDVASLTQQIEALKASIAELKSGQEQLSRDMSKAREVRPPEPRLSEARPVEPRPAKLGAPPHPLGAIVQHKPKPAVYPPAQGASGALLPPPGAAPQPVQIAPPPVSSASTTADDTVVRPPMPVR
jgi:hypothetical protein